MKTDRKKIKRACIVTTGVFCSAAVCAAAIYFFFPQVLPSGQLAEKVPAAATGTPADDTSAPETSGEITTPSASQPHTGTTAAPRSSEPAPSSTTAPQVTPVSEERYLTADTPVRASACDTAKKLGTATKNTRISVKGRCSNGWTQVVYKNKTGYVPSSSLTEKEPAVQTTSPYLIKVNRTQNLVTVYKKDSAGEYTKPYRAMVCSVGTSGNTPRGTFATTDRYTWRLLEGNVYGQYATRITGHILFHSVPYYTKNKGDLESAEYNKLGSAASLGCIRLSVKDAKWIYDNCPKNTAVVIYDSDAPEPLERPRPVKIDLNDCRRGWDPTDPDPKNPWNAPPAQTSGNGQNTITNKTTCAAPCDQADC